MTNNNLISRTDLLKGTVVTILMIFVFSLVGKLPLQITFVLGLVFTWLAFFYLYKKRIRLPDFSVFMPIFLVTLSWQFIHFNEEFLTGFYVEFPVMYGVEAYSKAKFVTINMISYFVFVIGAAIAFKTKYKFLLIPVLFYVIYGAIGNAISHTWWSISSRGYFPGLMTAQLYWFLGPLSLHKLLPDKKVIFYFIISFSVVLVSLISFFSE